MLTYQSSGVDIKKADILTKIIKDTVKNDNIGMFAGLFEHPYIEDYYFVSSTDGIGSKIIPLIKYNMYDCIANDLIAMNLNDIVCLGAKPLFFLDYIATNKLDVDFTAKVIKSLKSKLNEYNTVLLGGETSELKDLIAEKYFDMAGFSVGIVKKENVLSKEAVKENDVVIALTSNGIHSNGYTLIRKLFEQNIITEKEYKDTLKPTNIYVKEIIELCDKKIIKSCANITGGGIECNLKRIIPDNLCAYLFKDSILKQDIFIKLERIIGSAEAYKTFNMGVGFCIVVSEENVLETVNICKKYNPFKLGVIKKNEENTNICFR